MSSTSHLLSRWNHSADPPLHVQRAAAATQTAAPPAPERGCLTVAVGAVRGILGPVTPVFVYLRCRCGVADFSNAYGFNSRGRARKVDLMGVYFRGHVFCGVEAAYLGHVTLDLGEIPQSRKIFRERLLRSSIYTCGWGFRGGVSGAFGLEIKTLINTVARHGCYRSLLDGAELPHVPVRVHVGDP